MFLLDTDSASLAFGRNPVILARIQNTPAPVRLSSVAAEEFLRGTLGLVNKQRDKPGAPAAHALFVSVLQEVGRYEILAYDADAARVYASFSAQVRRVGTQDCRIAASAISRGLTVITANQKDFSRIPGVKFEDWSL